jgi:hypothetical protein
LIRNAYLRENVLQGNLSIPSEQTDLTTASETGAPQSSLAASINTIQADLYFESATGYGKWRILCAGLCLSDLARDGAQSELVLKRLEYVPVIYLQNGQEEAYIFTGNFRRVAFPKRIRSG